MATDDTCYATGHVLPLVSRWLLFVFVSWDYLSALMISAGVLRWSGSTTTPHWCACPFTTLLQVLLGVVEPDRCSAMPRYRAAGRFCFVPAPASLPTHLSPVDRRCAYPFLHLPHHLEPLVLVRWCSWCGGCQCTCLLPHTASEPAFCAWSRTTGTFSYLAFFSLYAYYERALRTTVTTPHTILWCITCFLRVTCFRMMQLLTEPCWPGVHHNSTCSLVRWCAQW